VFGTFDRLHPGHEHFLQQSREYGDYLIAVVARDSYIRQFKGREPFENEALRMENLRKCILVQQVIIGDEEIGSYKSLADADPDIICVGYDQEGLHVNLKSWIEKNNKPYKIAVMKSHKPQIYKTSIIHKEDIILGRVSTDKYP